jgi:hypothetical protein
MIRGESVLLTAMARPVAILLRCYVVQANLLAANTQDSIAVNQVYNVFGDRTKQVRTIAT